MFASKVLLSVILLTSNVSQCFFEIPIHHFFTFCLENIVFKKDRTVLWQSDSSVKQAFVLRKLRGLLENMRSMQLGLFGFL